MPTATRVVVMERRQHHTISEEETEAVHVQVIETNLTALLIVTANQEDTTKVDLRMGEVVDGAVGEDQGMLMLILQDTAMTET